MWASCRMFIALWWIYLSALHDHNYRLPKLIISSRLMCWRLFVMFSSFFFFHVFFCGQRVLRSCEQLVIRANCLIVLKRSIKKTANRNQCTSEQKKKAAVCSSVEKWMNTQKLAYQVHIAYMHIHTNSLTYSLFLCSRSMMKKISQAKNSNRTRARSINSRINSRSQRQCLLNNSSRVITTKFHAIKM